MAPGPPADWWGSCGQASGPLLRVGVGPCPRAASLPPPHGRRSAPTAATGCLGDPPRHRAAVIVGHGSLWHLPGHCATQAALLRVGLHAVANSVVLPALRVYWSLMAKKKKAKLNAGLAAYNAARKAAKSKGKGATKSKATAPKIKRKAASGKKRKATSRKAAPKSRKVSSAASYHEPGQASSSRETNPDATRSGRGVKTKGSYLF